MDLVFLGLQVIKELVDAREHHTLFGLAEVAEGDVEAYLSFGVLLEPCGPLHAARLSPGFNRTFIERQALVRNGQVHVVIDGVTEALATRARARRTFEAEERRLRVLKLRAVVFALEALAEAHLL